MPDRSSWARNHILNWFIFFRGSVLTQSAQDIVALKRGALKRKFSIEKRKRKIAAKRAGEINWIH